VLLREFRNSISSIQSRIRSLHWRWIVIFRVCWAGEGNRGRRTTCKAFGIERWKHFFWKRTFWVRSFTSWLLLCQNKVVLEELSYFWFYFSTSFRSGSICNFWELIKVQRDNRRSHFITVLGRALSSCALGFVWAVMMFILFLMWKHNNLFPSTWFL
jgi:hypothetical protein